MLHRILIADDSDSSRTALAALLAAHGFLVEQAVDGSHALQRLMVDRFDVTLLDVHMPSLTGIEVLAHLSRSGMSVPSILMTGRPSREIEMAALEFGAFAMLRKPIPAEILRLTIRQIVTRDDGAAPSWGGPGTA
ncbi:MAG TPA: response regulator [Planctomycetota bacterium]